MSLEEWPAVDVSSGLTGRREQLQGLTTSCPAPRGRAGPQSFCPAQGTIYSRRHSRMRQPLQVQGGRNVLSGFYVIRTQNLCCWRRAAQGSGCSLWCGRMDLRVGSTLDQDTRLPCLDSDRPTCRCEGTSLGHTCLAPADSHCAFSCG